MITNSKIYVFFKKMVILLSIPILIEKSGLIKFRNNNPHHWKYIRKILTESVNNNDVFKGIAKIRDEFIFNFLNLGCWLKFLFGVVVVIIAIKVLTQQSEKLITNIIKLIKKISLEISKVKDFFRGEVAKDAPSLTEKLNSVIRFGIIPRDISETKYLCISYIDESDNEYFGGIRLNKAIMRLPLLHLISRTGTETEKDVIPAAPIMIISKAHDIYLCGEFEDDTGTPQKKKLLSNEEECNIKIGDQMYKLILT